MQKYSHPGHINVNPDTDMVLAVDTSKMTKYGQRKVNLARSYAENTSKSLKLLSRHFAKYACSVIKVPVCHMSLYHHKKHWLFSLFCVK